MKKLSLLLCALMITGASFACEGDKKCGDKKNCKAKTECCKKGKKSKKCCKKGEKAAKAEKATPAS